MTEGGYKKDRFPNLQGEIFDCLICAKVVKSPQQCSGCGNLFCAECINDYIKKNNTCPNRCGSDINNMSSRALINIYRQLDIKCLKCPKIIKIGELEKHQELCGRPKCEYNELCEGYQTKKEQYSPFCSEKCKIFNTIIQTKVDPKAVYDLLSKYAPKNLPEKINSVQLITRGTGSTIALGWSKKQCGLNIVVSPDSASVFLKEEAYVFRTVLAAQSFTGGRHYWQIHADQKTENQLKIGVSASKNFNFDTAFCDHKFGFAFYGLGQLRHGSNATGVQYGKRFKKSGILGVYLNMDKGTLSFSLNGQDFGEAYQDNDLKVGPLYPAVALLHCSGCIIKGQLPIPAMYASK